MCWPVLRLGHSTRLGKPTPDRVGSGQGSQTYQHDAIGNITGRISGTLTTSYWYSDTAHKHSVTGLSKGGAYQYPLNGNVTQQVELSGTRCTKKGQPGDMPRLALTV